MRWIVPVAAVVIAQAAPAALPPPFPRPGVEKLLDNPVVQVWNVAWPKGQPTALHRHLYDLVGVYYEPGERVITPPDGAARRTSTPAWGTTAQRAGLTHIEEGVSDAPLRAVFVEMKQPRPTGADTATSDAVPFSGEGGTQKVDNDRVTMWEFTRLPAPAMHRHLRDAVVIAFADGKPRASWISRGTTHRADYDGTPSRIYIVEIK